MTGARGALEVKTFAGVEGSGGDQVDLDQAARHQHFRPCRPWRGTAAVSGSNSRQASSNASKLLQIGVEHVRLHRMVERCAGRLERLRQLVEDDNAVCRLMLEP